jgi:cyclic beta-1,2-glucan synthetase
MYRVGIEGVLGFTLRRAALHIDPCIPTTWPGYEIAFKRPRVDYRIVVENPDHVSHGVVRVELDGEEIRNADVPVLEDGRAHVVRVSLGKKEPRPG